MKGEHSIMKKLRSLLDILIENGTNERLDQIAFANREYQKTARQASKTFENFSDSLTPAQKKLFNAYSVNQNALSAQYSQLAYEQGLKDCAQLWTKLAHSK